MRKFSLSALALSAAAFAVYLLIGLVAGDPIEDEKLTAEQALLAKTNGKTENGLHLTAQETGLEAPTNFGRSATPSNNDKQILLRNVPIDTRSPNPAVPEKLKRSDQGRQLHIVHMIGPIKEGWIERLRNIPGLRIVSYLPRNSYLVYADKTARSQLKKAAAAGSYIDWEGPFHPKYKIHPALANLSRQEAAVTVQLLADTKGDLAAIKRKTKKVLVPPYKVLEYRLIKALVNTDDLISIARLPGVVNIEPISRPKLADERQGQIAAGNLNIGATEPFRDNGYLSWLIGKGFTTNPVDYPIVDVTDTGIDTGDSTTPGHPDFYLDGDPSKQSRITYALDHSFELSKPQDIVRHGTSVASIVAGYNDTIFDGAGFSYGLGLNPFGRIGSSKIFMSNGIYFPLLSAPIRSLQIYNRGARISNNSWGSPGGTYDTDAMEFDTLTRDADLLTPGNQQMAHVFSAGNEGPAETTISSPGTAKNVITVGASENYQPSSLSETADNAREVWGGSSRGPTKDGRIKPDIVAPGTFIHSAASQDVSYTAGYHPDGQTLYRWGSGASYAAPAVSGATSLLFNHYKKSQGEDPSPAMAKAYIINSSRYLNGPNDTLPSKIQGFGALDEGRAFDAVPRILSDQKIALDYTGDEWAMTGQVADPVKPFRVTLVWTDAPGATIAAPVNNDLNLSVEIGGSVYKGNNFSGGASVAGGNFDSTNNVESVFIPSTGGEFTVTVKAANINSDGVPGQGDISDQDFAIVIYNGRDDMEEQWVRTKNGGADDAAKDIVVDSKDNVVVTGASRGAGTGIDFLTLKYDNSGNLLWEQRYNRFSGQLYTDEPVAMAVDTAGNLFITGKSYNGSNYDYLTISYDTSGTLRWVQSYNGTANDADDYPADIAVDKRSDVIVTGRSPGVGTANDFVTIKYTNGGALAWGDTERARWNQWNTDNEAAALAIGENNDIYVTGRTWRASAAGAGWDISSLRLYSDSGLRVWERHYEGPASAAGDEPDDITVFQDSFVYLADTFVSYNDPPPYDQDMVTWQMAASDGGAIWNKLYPDPADNVGHDSPSKIALDADGNVYTTGASIGGAGNFDFATISYAPDGTRRWVERYAGAGNGEDTAHDLAVDPKGFVYITGGTGPPGAGYSRDITTIKYSAASGRRVHLRNWGAPGVVYDSPAGLDLDSHGNIYVAGTAGINGGDLVLIKYLNDLPPTTSLSTNPAVNNGGNGWFITVPTVSLNRGEAGDTYYQWDATSAIGWTSSSTTITAFSAPQGAHTLYFYSVDKNGNQEDPINKALLKVDTIQPAPFSLIAPINNAWGTARAGLSWHPSSDSGSGLSAYLAEQLVDAWPSDFWMPIGATPNTSFTPDHTVFSDAPIWRVAAVDVAGNNRLSSAGSFRVDPSAPSTVTLSGFQKSGAFEFFWQQSTDTGGSGLAGYQLLINGETATQTTVRTYTLPLSGVTLPVTATVLAIDRAGNRSPGSTFVFDPLSPGLTPEGPNQTVNPLSNVSVTYTNVTSPGTTGSETKTADWALKYGQLVKKSSGRFGSSYSIQYTPIQTFDITTTAGFTGDIIVAIKYELKPGQDAKQLRIFHYQQVDGVWAWVDVTVSVDVDNNVIYAKTKSFSPVALGYPEPATGVNTALLALLGLGSLIVGRTFLLRRKICS